MKKHNFVEDFPSLEDHFSSCSGCQYGKQSRIPFPQLNWRASHKMKLIHTDIEGPQLELSLKESRYYITFIDDFTRMC